MKTMEKPDSKKLKKYLLGQIQDENLLENIEARLLADQDFSTELEITEDEIIRDYLRNTLTNVENDCFKEFFLSVPHRQKKIRLARALREFSRPEPITSVERTGFFRNRFFYPQFAAALVLMIALIGFVGWIVLKKQPLNDEFVQLNKIYQKERPVEARISNFDYAPLVVRRGSEQNNQNELMRRKIESDLLAAAENSPGEKNYNISGVFYLTEKQFDRAIAQFEKGLQINNSDAELQSNLGASYLEKAKFQSGLEKSVSLEKALANLNSAIKIQNSQAAAIFNKALVLQEMNRPTEAIDVWNQYLQIDPNSEWSDEARRNLAKLQ